VVGEGDQEHLLLLEGARLVGVRVRVRVRVRVSFSKALAL